MKLGDDGVLTRIDRELHHAVGMEEFGFDLVSNILLVISDLPTWVIGSVELENG